RSLACTQATRFFSLITSCTPVYFEFVNALFAHCRFKGRHTSRLRESPEPPSNTPTFPVFNPNQLRKIEANRPIAYRWHAPRNRGELSPLLRKGFRSPQ